MIYGIGIDLVKIQRMKDADDKWGRKFFEKFLTPGEIAYCYKKAAPYPSIAVRFAAKEAIIKAIGSEITVNMKEIEIVNEDNGRPLLHTSGTLKAFMEEKNIKRCHLSLSHEKEYGVASVVLEV